MEAPTDGMHQLEPTGQRVGHSYTADDYNLPIRVLIRSYLRPVLAELWPKRVLDVGCGTAWLSVLVHELGASYTGIDSLAYNITAARQLYPGVRVYHKDLRDFICIKKFDVVLTVLSTEFMNDLQAAFRKWEQCMTPDGHLIIIAGSLDLFRNALPENISPSSPEAILKYASRPGPLTIDKIPALTKRYERVATSAGFELVSERPILADRQLIKALPQYADLKGKPVLQLLVFKRNS